ncbi:MAG: M15 family metallopeptidase [Victivallaceae bacterium]|nr:M15 family metallopeptidase [Victivallaceae bacterium]
MNNQTRSESSRRAYWTEQTESACGFMAKMRDYPVKECGETLVPLRQAVKDARLTVKFSDKQLAGKYDHIFYLREGLVKKFLAVAKEMNNLGWFLKVEDCFRSRVMQKCVGLQKSVFDQILKAVIWENNGKVPAPELMLRRLMAFIAASPKTGTHLSGSALDISVYHAGSLRPLDRGAPYQEISELTFMNSPFIPKTATHNRLKIRTILEKYGFMPYPFEFWHFSQGDAYSEYLTNSGKPARYGAIDFNLFSGNVTVIGNPETPLYSLDEIGVQIEAALSRLSKKN